MFQKVKVPVRNNCPPLPFPTPPLHPNIPKTQILGMVQNMSSFTCPVCSHTTSIFSPHPRHDSSGSGGGIAQACRQHGICLLGDIPLHASICDDADRGMPTVVAEPAGSERVEVFMKIAEKLAAMIELKESVLRTK